jgi:hypothetical protein
MGEIGLAGLRGQMEEAVKWVRRKIKEMREVTK